VTTAETIRGDWRHKEVEDVTFTSSTSGTSQENVKAERTDLDYREAVMAGPMVMEDAVAVWIVWDETLGNITPKQGDKITDAQGVVSVVQSLRWIYSGGVIIKWRCVCRRQV
jgi:hypothetical protein